MACNITFYCTSYVGSILKQTGSNKDGDLFLFIPFGQQVTGQVKLGLVWLKLYNGGDISFLMHRVHFHYYLKIESLTQ